MNKTASVLATALLLTGALLMAPLACCSSGSASAEASVNLNLAPRATITASSEEVRKRKYFARCVADGLIPVENRGYADYGLKQGVWSIDPTADKQSGWLKFRWKEPVRVRELVFFQKTVWSPDDCWKDYQVCLGDSLTPVARGTLTKKSGPQAIRLDQARAISELTLKFTSAYGGTPGADEVFVFPEPASKRDILLAMGGWKLATDPFLYLHLPTLGLAHPSAADLAALIDRMKQEHGDRFDAVKFKQRLATLTNNDPADDSNPKWGYRVSPLGKLQFQILLYDGEANDAPVPAFPGAEGFGMWTTGGRGGRVIEVTNLADSGPGSFRAAVEAQGPRTVVFRVGGTIRLEDDLRITNGDLTIAGQTAPGDGVCIQGLGPDVCANNVIIRFLRARPGDVLGRPIGDAISGRFIQDVILDHCSMSWSMDEVCTWYALGNVTVQWCTMTESLDRSMHPKGSHGAGHATGGFNLSSHHNLIAHTSFRNPRFAACGLLADSLVDFRNNVVYDFVTPAYGGEGGTYNFCNNYYKRGLSSSSRPLLSPYKHQVLGYGKWHITGNIMEGNQALNKDNWRGVDRAVPRADQPFPAAPITTQSAQEAYQLVLDKVGAIYPKRDPVDARVINDVRNGTGKIINSQKDVGGYPELKSGPAPIDTDHDGLPDDWEKNYGLDPNDSADGAMDKDGDGYTNLEEYLNRTDPTRFIDYTDLKNNLSAYHQP